MDPQRGIRPFYWFRAGWRRGFADPRFLGDIAE